MRTHIPRLSFTLIFEDVNTLISKHRRFWWGYFFACYAPMAVIQSFVFADFSEIFRAIADDDLAHVQNLNDKMGSYTFLSFLLGMISIYFYCFTAWAVFRQWGGIKYTTRELLWLSLQKWPFVLTTGLLMVVLLILPMLCFVLPGLFLAVCWSMALYLVIFLDLNFLDALRTSYDMVIKQWFKVFLLFLGSLLIAGITELLLMLLTFWAPEPFTMVLISAVSLYFSVFWAVMFLHLYNYVYPPGQENSELTLQT